MPTITVAGIPVLWEEPAQTERRKLVVWLPGFTSDKDGVREYLRDLAAAGYVAVSFDPVDHGERSRRSDQELVDSSDGSFRIPESGQVYRHFWSIVAETAAETPAIIDWAVAELGVAPVVGMGGISMGGNITLAAAALDRRIGVVAAGIAEADWLRPGSTIPISAPNAYVQAHYDRYNPLTNLARYQHCPAMLLSCGAVDPLIPPGGAQRFVRALAATYADCPEKLELVLEDGVGHIFTETMWRRSLSWFERFL
jgi:dienelactone hydrolase